MNRSRLKFRIVLPLVGLLILVALIGAWINEGL